jgi:hypothetical protein
MTITSLRIVIVVVAALSTYSQSFAEERYFNSYMLRALEVIKQSTNAKYDEHKWFTKNLDYGTQKAIILASKPPYTMCNAAVTEVILDAINLYAADHKDWSPEDAIPASSWMTARWSQLMPHMFSHDYEGYPPLEDLLKAHIKIEPGLEVDIKNFESLHGMSFALEKFGLGETVKFEDARPGDVISFDRDRVNGGNGHSAIFLAFLTQDQKETLTFKAGAIVGFKYFSIQSSEPAGLGERWAYFKVTKDAGICPYSTDIKMPTSSGARYCADAIDTEANRIRFRAFALKSGQPRDCCVFRSGDNGPRVGRVFMPPYWTYSTKQKEVQKQEENLKDHVEEFMENLSRTGERLRLYGIGALKWEQDKPKAAGAYINEVRRRFNIDLRTVAEAKTPPEIGRQELREISRITPKNVVQQANITVTTALKKEMDQRVRSNAAAQVMLLHERTDGGVPNPKLDGRTTD